MKVLEIYEKYEIPDNLKLHVLCVAAVAKIVMDRISNFDGEDVLQACLLHDLGNIVKFRDIESVDWAKEKGVDYWLGVQKKFWQKYGKDDHKANELIMKEIGVDDKIIELASILSFEPGIFDSVAKGSDLERKIVLYADSRISPQGVVVTKERMDDIRKRYFESGIEHTLKREDYERARKPVLEVARQIEELVGEDLLYLTNEDLEEQFEELLSIVFQQ